MFIQESRPLCCIIMSSQFIRRHVSTHAKMCTNRNVTLFLLSLKTVAKEPISMSNGDSQTSTELLIHSKNNIAYLCTLTPSFQHNQCALTYANKPCPGGSVYCRSSIVYCVTDSCYINKNDGYMNNASADLTLSEYRRHPYAQLICHLPLSSRR